MMTQDETRLLQLADDLRGEIQRLKRVNAKQETLITAQSSLIKAFRQSRRADQHRD